MTYILEVNESVRDKVLWMLDHFKEDVTIRDFAPIEETSPEETAELLEMLSAIPAEDREIDPALSVRRAI